MAPPALTLMLTPHLPLAVSGVEIVVVLLFVVGGVLKNLFDKAAGSGGNRPTMTTPPLVPPRPPATLSTEEDRARKLMEALGLPVANPPPVLMPPVVAAPRPVRPPLPPNVVVTRRAVPPPLPLLVEPAGGVLPPKVANRRRPASDLDPAIRRRAAGADPTGQTLRPPAATANLRGLLRASSRSELRRAILLREVLGPPRALSEVGGNP